MYRKIAIIILVLSVALITSGCGGDEVHAKKATDDTVPKTRIQCNEKFIVDHPEYTDGNICGFTYNGMKCLYSGGNGGGVWCDNSHEVARHLISEANKK